WNWRKGLSKSRIPGFVHPHIFCQVVYEVQCGGGQDAVPQPCHVQVEVQDAALVVADEAALQVEASQIDAVADDGDAESRLGQRGQGLRSEEHTSELQSRENLVCRLLLEKKK